MDYRGHIQLILGPMFSGKSTELLRRCKRYTIANKDVALIKYHADARYSDTAVATHDKQTLEAFSCERLEQAREHVATAQVVAIDEGQFFADVVEFAEDMANAGKVVLVAALDGTFQRKPFGSILHLVPLAEEVTKLNAVCMVCFQAGSFSKRLGSETAVELIGGADKYVAVCRRCYHADCEPAAKAAAGAEPGTSTTDAAQPKAGSGVPAGSLEFAITADGAVHATTTDLKMIAMGGSNPGSPSLAV